MVKHMCLAAFLIVLVVVFFRIRGWCHRSGLRIGTGKGVVFGRLSFPSLCVYSPESAEGHIVVFGGSGSGKTSALLIPTLRHWGGSSFVIDISGDISRNVDCQNKLVYEPGSSESAPYNVFAQIDALDDKDDADEALAQLALLIMPNLQDASAAAKYFQDGGRSILTAALIAYYHQGKDFTEICATIIEADYKRLFSAIDQTKDAGAIRYISPFVGGSEQNISGCKQNCDDAIKLFVINRGIRSSIRRPLPGEFAFSPVAIEDHNVFVLIPDEKLELFAPLLHIITAQCLSYFSGRPSSATTTILFALDEFASLGNLEITGALRKLRKKHIRIMVLTQSLADIEDIYGRGAYRSMLSNFAYKVILSVGEMETQEYFAKLIGQQINQRKSITSSGSALQTRTSTTVSPEKDYIVQPADLAHLGKYLVLLHPDGTMGLRKNFYYKRHLF